MLQAYTVVNIIDVYVNFTIISKYTQEWLSHISGRWFIFMGNSSGPSTVPCCYFTKCYTDASQSPTSLLHDDSRHMTVATSVTRTQSYNCLSSDVMAKLILTEQCLQRIRWPQEDPELSPVALNSWDQTMQSWILWDRNILFKLGKQYPCSRAVLEEMIARQCFLARPWIGRLDGPWSRPVFTARDHITGRLAYSCCCEMWSM